MRNSVTVQNPQRATCSYLALEARGLVRLAQCLQRALSRAVAARMALLQLDGRAHAEQRVHPGQQLRAMGVM